MYTVLHRTGISGGRLYNLTGDNLTEALAGAGNAMVGPWQLDYSAFVADTEGVSNVNWDSEFSGMVIDGRALKDSSSDDPMIFADLDEDEALSDSRSIVRVGDRAARCKHLRVRLYHTGVLWEDARVWTLNMDGTHSATAVPLDEYLEELYGESDDGLWHPVRHALRVPINWAIYHIPLTPRYTGLTEMINANTATTVGDGDLLSYGPVGMLTAMHGAVYAAQHGLRLYEANLANWKAVERGMYLMPYDSAHEDDVGDPDYLGAGAAGDATITGTVEETNQWQVVGGPLPIPETMDAQSVGDRAVNLTMLGGTTAASSILDTPAQRARGRIYTTVIGTGRDMTASAKRVTVWHWQTCPVRLRTVPVAGGGFQHHIIGGLVSPFQGPPVRLVYHEGTARYSSR